MPKKRKFPLVMRVSFNIRCQCGHEDVYDRGTEWSCDHQACELCGHHETIKLHFKCKGCGEYHSIVVRDM